MVTNDLRIQIHDHCAAVAMLRREFEASNESVAHQPVDHRPSIFRVRINLVHVAHPRFHVVAVRVAEHVGNRIVRFEQAAIRMALEHAGHRVLEQRAVFVLGCGDRILLAALVGDVDRGTFIERDPAVGIADRAHVFRNPDDASVAPVHARDRVDDTAFAIELLEQFARPGEVDVPFLGAFQRRGQHFGWSRKAEHLRERRIDVDESAFGKTAVDAFDGRVEQRAVAVDRRLFACALRRAVAFGDVLDDGKYVVCGRRLRTARRRAGR